MNDGTSIIDEFLKERIQIRQLDLKNNAIFYSMDNCIKNYDKIGLTDTEKECIKNRTYTYFLYYKYFNLKQRENFQKFLKK